MADSRKPLTIDETRNARDQLFIAVGELLETWSEVDAALCKLFAALMLAPPVLTNAAFYAINTAEGRIGVISDLVQIRFCLGREVDNLVTNIWMVIKRSLNNRKKVRNTVAHGGPATISLTQNNIHKVVWGPQLTDVLGMSKLIGQRSPPYQIGGLSPNDINQSAKATIVTAGLLLRFGEAIYQVDDQDQGKATASLHKLRELAKALQVKFDQETYAAEAEQSHPSEPSPE
jgi:hypothetical protein